MDKKVILRNVGKRNRSYYNHSIAIIVFCFIKTKSKLRRTFPQIRNTISCIYYSLQHVLLKLCKLFFAKQQLKGRQIPGIANIFNKSAKTL